MIRFGWMGFVLGACSAEAGGLASCAGDYVGTYDGDDVGGVAATLSADGALEVLFTSSAGEISSSGVVEPNGDVSGEDQGTSVTGKFDFDACTAAGSWVTLGTLTGTWAIALE